MIPKSEEWTSLDKKAYSLIKGKSRMETDQIIAELEKEKTEK